MSTEGELHRPWTAKERALVLRHYGPSAAEPLPTREIAHILGRPKKHVNNAARRYGCPTVQTHTPILDPGRLALVRECHARGLSLTDAAKELGISRQHLRRLYDAQGLCPPLRFGQAGQSGGKKIARRLKARMRRGGYRNLAHLRNENRRLSAAGRWGCTESVPEANLLDQLEGEVEGVSIRDLAGRLGFHYAPKNSYLAGLLRRLMRRGLVERVKGHRPYVWRLAPGVTRRTGTEDEGPDEPLTMKPVKIRLSAREG